MKLIFSNGKKLEVRDVSEPLITLTASTVPLKHNGHHIVTDEKAREILRELIGSGLYVKK